MEKDDHVDQKLKNKEKKVKKQRKPMEIEDMEKLKIEHTLTKNVRAILPQTRSHVYDTQVRIEGSHAHMLKINAESVDTHLDALIRSQIIIFLKTTDSEKKYKKFNISPIGSVGHVYYLTVYLSGEQQ